MSQERGRSFSSIVKQNPVIPLGMAAMVFCILKGIHHTHQGDTSLANKFGQARVAIGVSIIGYFLYSRYKNEQRWERDISEKRELNKYRDWKAEDQANTVANE